MKSVTKINMKTPISYYGGKQQMVTTILPLIPPHHLYTEAFCGGAAIYWAKEPSTIEVINDKNSEVSNFYTVAKNNFEELQKMVTTTLHSREAYVKAMEIYKNPTAYTAVERAWAFWVGCNMSYLSSIGGGFAYQRKGKNRCALKVANNRENFVVSYADRLRETTVEHDDALKVIARYDCEEAFHYVDPPYFNANMGHYKGYTEDNFLNLLELLSVVKGKFLLSSYPSDLLSEFILNKGWYKKELTMRSSATRNQKNKVEVLTANYDINQPLGKMISFGVSSAVEAQSREVILKAA
jgi:DNA adenine methylase